jgi:hypothetical protein
MVELSLYFYLMDNLSVLKTGEVLTSTDLITYPVKFKNVITNNELKVYVNGFVQDENTYTFDFPNGVLRFNTNRLASDAVKIDYRYCYLNIYDEGQFESKKDIQMPCVVIAEEDFKDVGYELGTSKKERNGVWNIAVFSDRGGERNDITDEICELLEIGTLPVINYGLNFPFLSNGQKNTLFDSTAQIAGYMSFNSINSFKAGSYSLGDKPAYTSEILVNMTINKN